MKKLNFLLIILMSTSLFGTNQQCNTLTMEEAVKQALLKKDSIHAKEYAIKGFKEQRKGTISSFLPNVSLNERLHCVRSISGNERTLGIQASQTIFDLSKTSQYKAASAQVSTAQHDLERHSDEVQFNTEAAFLNAWLIQRQLGQMLLLYKASKETMNQADKQYELNLLDKNDWLTAKANHAANLSTVNSYLDQVRVAEQTIEYYTKLPVKLLPNATTTPTILLWNINYTPQLQTIDFYNQKARVHRKDLKMQQDTIELKDETSKSYIQQYIPTVSLFGSVTNNTFFSRNTAAAAGVSSTAKDVGVQISWNFFDGLSSYFNSSAAKAEKMQAVLDKNDLSSKIKLDVQNAYTAVQTQQNTLVKERSSFIQKTNEFELKKLQASSELISPVDLENAKSNFETARISLYNQLITTAAKERELLFTCGYPTL